MDNVTSVSGGKTSAFLAANFPTKELVFSLVRIEDKECTFPDAQLRKIVEDRIQAPFIGTAEDDIIIYTILDLEQHLGTSINWVSGPTFEWVLANRGGWLPNKLHRYCTTSLKIEPIFNWWVKQFGVGNPVEMNIGYRANEVKRANKMAKRLDKDGLLSMKATFEKWPSGRNKWVTVPWQKPCYPLIEASIYKDAIEDYWRDKKVRFAPFNNCIGCFNRNPVLLKHMFNTQPNKMAWFEKQEVPGKGTWKKGGSYSSIKKHYSQLQLFDGDFSPCDSGYCGL